jgi:hypothetical protein
VGISPISGISSTAEKLASAKTALSYSQRAVKIDPKSCEAQLGIAICLEQGFDWAQFGFEGFAELGADQMANGIGGEVAE